MLVYIAFSNKITHSCIFAYFYPYGREKIRSIHCVKDSVIYIYLNHAQLVTAFAEVFFEVVDGNYVSI
jgi:hypothetical protein